MGAMIFSEKPQIVLELNQTDPCYVIPFMANDLLKNRQVQLSTQSNKTTDLIEAAYVSADFILNTNLSKVMMSAYTVKTITPHNIIIQSGFSIFSSIYNRRGTRGGRQRR